MRSGLLAERRIVLSVGGCIRDQPETPRAQSSPKFCPELPACPQVDPLMPMSCYGASFAGMGWFAMKTSGQKAFLPAAVAVFLAIAGAATARAAEAERVQARFEIFSFAGFHVLTNRIRIEETADRYAIETDLDTRGIASLFVDLTSRSKVHGALNGGTPRPQAYRSEVLRNGVDRRYQVDYRGDGTVANISPKPVFGLSLISGVERMRATVDQLTAYFLLERQLTRGGSCAMVVPVFDGSGLYNLRFADVKKDTLAADSRQNFAGPAQLCEVVREDIATNPDHNESTYERGRIWYARIAAGGRMEPVRLEYDTAFGVVRGYLAEWRGRGVDLRLMAD